MKTIIVTLLIALLPNRQAVAASEPDDRELRKLVTGCSVSEDCDLILFKEISKFFRASGKEAAVGHYIQSLYSVAATTLWPRGQTSINTDSVGNIVIRLPGTGRFKNTRAKPLALQAHLDMVLAYALAKPGENVEPYFANGVEMEEVAGWLQSKDRITTLGADNGVGVAYAIRYLLSPKLAHPPLELVFTTQEEVGLKGASQMQIPLLSRRMICLDGMTNLPHAIITASQGSFGARLSLEKIPAQTLTDVELIQITLSNLSGGHSGNDIFRDRLNSVRGFALFFHKLKAEFSGARIVSLIAGDKAVLNKIPNLFSSVIAIPKASATTELQKRAIEASAKKYIHEIVSVFSDEVGKPYVAEATFLPTTDQVNILGQTQTEALVNSLLNSPNGVIEKDPQFPNEVKTSSNLSFVVVEPRKEGRENLFGWSSGFFTRSYDSKALKNVSANVRNELSAPMASQGLPEMKIQSSYEPWVAPATTTLQRHILKNSGIFTMTTKASVGLEPSSFMQKYPDMDVVAIAPNIMEAHTVNERVELESLRRVSWAIEKILSTMPK